MLSEQMKAIASDSCVPKHQLLLAKTDIKQCIQGYAESGMYECKIDTDQCRGQDKEIKNWLKEEGFKVGFTWYDEFNGYFKVRWK